ncbi:MAG: DNA mismatch repair endonuclease MutL, partial [Cytophagales bacterium]|nr:DNA mismatch repair endonuclease MutL [Cytophagales bacterium]
MPDIIQLLPDSIANQIAAGEVIQRPASAVKELLENAIDADATEIKLIVKDAGKGLIQVIDNGMGMSPVDARMCFERHATSKIKKADDLFTIRTMGFRGEAMASIAAVAQVEMKTKRQEDELGTWIRIEGSEIKEQDFIACEKGTSTSIKNLFYNVPARRNFLKSDPVELKHILEELIRVALAFPEIAFSLYSNDLEIMNLRSGNLAKRIVSIFGDSYREQLVSVQEEVPYMKVTGYIGRPESAKRTRGEQYFFINQRFIKHPYLHHAVAEAFEKLLPDETYPFYAIFMEMDPKHIDINVHPTKTEIKFDDERTVYGIMKSAVRKALATHNMVPSIDFTEKSTFTFDGPAASQFSRFSNTPVTNNVWKTNETTEANVRHWEKLYQTDHMSVSPSGLEQDNIIISSKANLSDSPKIELASEIPANENIFQLHQNYIVTQVKSGMLIIDQQAAHERILYEKYMLTLEKKFGASQQFLFPVTIEMNPSDLIILTDIEHEIQMLGFSISLIGGNTVMVNGIPSDMKTGDEKKLLEGLIEQYKRNKND